MRYVTIGLPEELTEALAPSGGDLPRAALEALATEAYRKRKISHAQFQQLLGFETRMEVDGFLKERGVELGYTAEDLERDRRTLRELGLWMRAVVPCLLPPFLTHSPEYPALFQSLNAKGWGTLLIVNGDKGLGGEPLTGQ